MVTVHRAHGMRFVIYIDDHEPAHVHVIGNGEAKVQLHGDRANVEVIWSIGLSRGDLRKAVREVAQHRDALMRIWSEIHDRTDRRPD